MDGRTGNAAHLGATYTERQSFLAQDVVREIWTGMGLPVAALSSLWLPGDDGQPAQPSSFKIGVIAQSSIALSALAAAQVYALHHGLTALPGVEVALKDASIEFKSEQLYRLNNQRPPTLWGPIGGLHPAAAGGYIRIHDGFPLHRLGALKLLGLPPDATHADVSRQTRRWDSVELETTGLARGLAMYALRSYEQWDALPQSRALADLPVTIRKVAAVTVVGSTRPTMRPTVKPTEMPDKCLRGVRVLEMSRVIAAPVAGRTLAAHGADVIWVTSPKLPGLPDLDCDMSRGKRTVQVDLDNPADKAHLLQLAATCDVFLQGYRPGSLARKGLAPEELAAVNPGIVCANLSAFGPAGPWSDRRGYDSLVQTCSGMNISEAEHYGDDGNSGGGDNSPARPTPSQVLDHAAGYLLAAGIGAALYHRATAAAAVETATEAGETQGLVPSYCVDVSLAGVMKYLRSLGQYPGRSGFDAPDYKLASDVPDNMEERESGLGILNAVRHSAKVIGCAPGWDIMPKPLGSDKAEWLA